MRENLREDIFDAVNEKVWMMLRRMVDQEVLYRTCCIMHPEIEVMNSTATAVEDGIKDRYKTGRP